MSFKNQRIKAITGIILILALAAGLFTPPADMPQARAAGGGPDLVVDAVTAPDTILAGREVSVTASVYNTGNAPAAGFAVTLYAGGEEIQSKTVSSVYAGESARVIFAWTPAQPGDYVLKAVADSGGAVSEADENNNELTKNVTVSSGWEKISNFPANADYSYIWQSLAGNVYLSVKHKDGNSKLYRYTAPDTFAELGSLPGMSMSAIGGVSDDRIYVAESTNKKIWLYDGASFIEMARENSGTVNAFWTAGSGETYAVGADGGIEKYDPAENKWKAMASPTTGYLFGIWGTGPGDIYAVGEWARVIHYDGSDWSIVYDGSRGTLRSVWGLSATDVYVCGDNGTILHFDGSSWTVMSGTGTSDKLYSIIGTAWDDIYAFGGASAAVILHFNGAAWSSVSPPSTTGKLRKAIITSNEDLLVSGYSGTLLKHSSRVPGADLAVKDIELAAGVFQPGTPAQVKVKVENRGAGEAPAGFKVKLSTADPAWEQEQAVTEAVYSGGVREVTFEWTPPQAQVVNLTALADSGGEVDEYNENNNEYTKAVAAKKLRLTTSVPQGGGRIEVYPAADEYNYGDTVRLSAVADPEYIFTEWGGDLSGNANPAAVVMDSDKQITAVFTEARNDLELADLNFVDPEGMQWNYLLPGHAWLVNVEVRNNGINPADGVAVDIFADGVTVGTATIDNLAPGEVKSVAVPWTPTASGSVNVRAAARHTGGVTETYTANNEKELTVDVLPSLTREAVSMNVPVVNVHVDSQTGELINIGPGIKKIIGFSPAELYAATDHGILWYDGAGNWTFLQGTVGRRFIDIGGASGSALYAVSSGDGVSAVYRFNGATWTQVEGSVLNRDLRETWIDNSGGIYAVATGPAELFYFNGSTWQKLENAPQDNYLNTVWGTGPDNVYLGGSKLYRYDGSNWSEVDAGFTTSSGMMKIWGASPTSVYVMRGKEIRHFDGSSWTGIPTLSPNANVTGLCECGDVLYEVCGGKLFLYEGGAWKWVDVPRVGDVYNPLEGCLLLTGDLGKLYYYGTALGDISGGGGQQPQVATASIRVEGYSGTILPKTEVTVDAFDLTPYLGPASGGSATPSTGWGPDRLQYPTVAHALVKALTEAGIDCTDHVNGLDLQDYGWSLYVAMIAGEREFDQGTNSGWYYYVDGKLPSFGCQAYTLKGGEDIVWSYVRDYTEVWYSFLTADKTAVAAGDSVRLGLQGYRCDMMGAGGTESLFGRLTLYVQKGTGEKTECAEGVSNDDFECPGFDEEGNLIVRFKTPGEYTISADHPPGVDIVRPASLKVTVEAGGTPDTTPPAFAEGYPRAEDVTAASFTLKLKLAEPGTVYYRVVVDGADPGSDYETWAAVSVPGTGEVGQAVGGLSPGTAYDVYVIARDAAGNWQSAPVKLDVATPAESALRVAGKAIDPSVTLAAGNRTVGAGDQSWTIEVTSGTVKEDVAAADLTITGLPAGLSASVARGEGNTIVITVTGTAEQAVSRLTTVSVAVRGSAVAEPGAADSEPVSVFLNPAPVREQQVTVSAEQPDLTLDRETPPATVVVPQSVTDARISLVPLLSEADGAKTATLPAELTVRADTSAGQIRVEIPAGTAVTAPAAWTGALNVPAVRPNSSVTVTPDPGKTATVHAVVEVGFDDVPLTFDRAVRLVFPGQAGKEVGYCRGGAFTRITTVMTSDTQEAGDALPAGGDGRIDVGQDLVVWTKHFTRFVVYTQSATGSGGSSGGGGRWSSSAGQAVSSPTGSAVVTPGAGGTVSLGGEVRLEIPAGALRGTSPVEVKIQKVTSPPAVPAGLRTLGNAYQFSVGGATGYNFPKPVTLSLAFDSSVLKPGEKAEVYSYDPSSQKWVSLGGTVSGNTITVTVDHGNIFAVLARTEAKPVEEETTVKLTDIAGHWAQKEIEYMAGKGYVVGVGDNRFAPEATVTRAQFAVIAARLAGLKAEPEGAGRFSDVPADAWYRGMVGAAAEAGLVAGTGETTFAPDEPITREQMAALLVRLLAKNGLDVSIGDDETAQLLAGFTDAAEISPWARAAVALAVKEKLMLGREGGRFAPRGRATRAEAAVVLCRLLEKLPQVGR